MYWNFNSPDDSIEIGVHPLSPKKNNIKVPFDNGFSHPTLFIGGSDILITISFIDFIYYDISIPALLSCPNNVFRTPATCEAVALSGLAISTMLIPALTPPIVVFVAAGKV